MPLPAEFFDTPRLSVLRAVARARQVAPDYLLAVAMARAACRVTPRVVLPPIVGADASLNTFFGVVGRSGLGKGIGMAAGVAALPISTAGSDPIVTENLGSGERLAGLFVRRDKGKPPVQYQESVLLTCPEVDLLLSLTARQGSTLDPILRSLYSGEAIGMGYMDDTKRLPVPAHHARACLVAGVQPARAGVLYGRQAVDGGLSQRMILFDGIDPSAPRRPPPMPEVPLWSPPAGWCVVDASEVPTSDEIDPRDVVSPFTWTTPVRIDVDSSIWVEVQDARWRVLTDRAPDDPLNAHRNLNRLKAATFLMLFDHTGSTVPALTAEHWQRAGLILDVSDQVRAGILAELPKADREYAELQGELDALRKDSADNHRFLGTAMAALKHVEQHAQSQPYGCTVNCLKKAVTARRRPMMLEALQQLMEDGRLISEIRPAPRQGGDEFTYWRLAQ